MQAPFVFCQQSWGGLQLGAFKGFQCHCNERKEEKKSEGKSARERGREGWRKGGREEKGPPRRARPGGEMQGSGPSADTAPHRHRGARRPRNYPLRPGCHFPRSWLLPRGRRGAPAVPTPSRPVPRPAAGAPRLPRLAGGRRPAGRRAAGEFSRSAREGAGRR